MRGKLLILGLCCFASSGMGRGNLTRDVDVIHVRPFYYSFLYEVLRTLDPDTSALTEDIGVLGPQMHLLFDSGVYLGLGGFGAISGNGAGFSVLGANIGYDWKIYKSVRLLPEIFLGAGGGSRVPVGSGLVLRTSLALGLEMDTVTLLVGYSLVKFPWGFSESKQPFLQCRIRSDLSYLRSYKPTTEPSGILFSRKNWKWGIWRLVSSGKLLNLRGQVDLEGNKLGQYSVLGSFGVDHFFHSNFFTSFGFAGAVNRIPGFYQVGMGLGTSINLAETFYFEPKFMVGFAGGGNVDVGSGFIIEPEFDFVIYPFWPMGLHFKSAYIYPSTGPLRVFSVSLGMSVRFGAMEWRESTPIKQIDVVGSHIPRSPWRFSLSSQRYFLNGRINFSANSQLVDIDLMGFSLDYFVLPFAFMNLGTYWPFSGGVGGTGAIVGGVGFYYAFLRKWHLRAVGRVGSLAGDSTQGGSGGIMMGGGDLEFEISPDISFFGGGGWMKYFKGLSTNYGEVGIRYTFSLPWTMSPKAPRVERTRFLKERREKKGKEVERDELERAAQQF